jgi:hypothetical protein
VIGRFAGVGDGDLGVVFRVGDREVVLCRVRWEALGRGMTLVPGRLVRLVRRVRRVGAVSPAVR